MAFALTLLKVNQYHEGFVQLLQGHIETFQSQGELLIVQLVRFVFILVRLLLGALDISAAFLDRVLSSQANV